MNVTVFIVIVCVVVLWVRFLIAFWVYKEAEIRDDCPLWWSFVVLCLTEVAALILYFISPYNSSTYKQRLKYSSSHKMSYVKIQNGKKLKCIWHIISGEISVFIIYRGHVLKAFDNSTDGNILNTELDVGEYFGKKVELSIVYKKASGIFEFKVR